MVERDVRLLRSCRDTALADPAARRRLEELPRAVRFGSRTEAARWLATRLPALRGAARDAVGDGQLDSLGRRLVTALLTTLDTYGHDAGPTPERRELHGLLWRIAERGASPADRAAALINLADLDMAAGRAKEAVDRYRAALRETRGPAAEETAGRAMEALAGAYLELGDSERAADWLGRALALQQSRGRAAEVARLHGELGDLHRDHGRFAAALVEWRSAAVVHRRARDLAGYATALAEAARVQAQAGQGDEALRGAHEALRWARQAADPAAEGTVLLGLAAILDRLGDRTGARLQRQAAADLLDRARRPGADPAAGRPGQ
jgi:tetratricopeptide (TPR) repeat protein